MSKTSNAEIMYSALALRGEINDISSKFEGVGDVFESVSLNLPRLEPAELGFIRVVSWLYVHYFESGKLGTEFLTALIQEYVVESSEFSKKHREIIQRLRTYCQHNLDPSQHHSKEIQRVCEDWFYSHCGTRTPRSDAHWEKLLDIICCEAVKYLECLRDVLRGVEADPACLQITEQWVLRVSRFHAPHKFDELISEVAADFGRAGIDAVKLRKRYYDRWRKEFEVKTDDCDFYVEARKLVEHVLLMEQLDVLPITGQDVMTFFEVPPGPRVKEILLIARQLYGSEPCSKEVLVERVRVELARE